MTFCTSGNCIDGRIQAPVATYLQERFRVSYVDPLVLGLWVDEGGEVTEGATKGG